MIAAVGAMHGQAARTQNAPDLVHQSGNHVSRHVFQNAVRERDVNAAIG